MRASCFRFACALTAYARHTNALLGSLFETNGAPPFQRSTTPYVIGFRVFSLPVMGPFQLSLAVLCAIGLPTCLALAVDACHLRSSYPRTVTPVLPNPSVHLYGAFTLCGATFQSTSRNPVAGDTTPTSPVPFGWDSVCASPFSVARTNGMPIGLSSCGY